MDFKKKSGIVYYFNGAMAVFQHCENDYASFRMFTTQLIVNGNAKQVEVVKAFGVSPSSAKRWTRKYREHGSEAFFYRKSNANLEY